MYKEEEEIGFHILIPCQARPLSKWLSFSRKLSTTCGRSSTRGQKHWQTGFQLGAAHWSTWTFLGTPSGWILLYILATPLLVSCKYHLSTFKTKSKSYTTSCLILPLHSSEYAWRKPQRLDAVRSSCIKRFARNMDFCSTSAFALFFLSP